MAPRERIPTLSDVKELVDGRAELLKQEMELVDGWLESKFGKAIDELSKRVGKLESRQTLVGVLTVIGAIVGGFFGAVFK